MITESREIDRWQVAGLVVLTEHPPGGWFVLESVGEDGIVRSVDSLTNLLCGVEMEDGKAYLRRRNGAAHVVGDGYGDHEFEDAK